MTDLEYVVETIARTAVENEKYFGDLDAVVGDGDFGYSLARGFELVIAGWDGFDRRDAGTFLKQMAMIVAGHVGGTSGPIWGTAFLRASTVAGTNTKLDGASVVAMLRAAIAGIKARGKADLGDKTLLDALIPATDALESAVRDGASGAAACASFASAARESAEATRTLQARRGRASYAGERSVGSLDAGAVAVAVIAERVAKGWSSAG